MTGKSTSLGAVQKVILSLPSSDYNNDGYLDVFIANLMDVLPSAKNVLFMNNGNGVFPDRVVIFCLPVFRRPLPVVNKGAVVYQSRIDALIHTSFHPIGLHILLLVSHVLSHR